MPHVPNSNAHGSLYDIFGASRFRLVFFCAFSLLFLRLGINRFAPKHRKAPRKRGKWRSPFPAGSLGAPLLGCGQLLSQTFIADRPLCHWDASGGHTHRHTHRLTHARIRRIGSSKWSSSRPARPIRHCYRPRPQSCFTLFLHSSSLIRSLESGPSRSAQVSHRRRDFRTAPAPNSGAIRR